MSSLTTTQPQTLSLVQAVGSAQALAAIETEAAQVIASLPTLTMDELAETRRRAKTLGNWAWRIEAEVDRELLRRADGAVALGRGKKDIEGNGVDATAGARAADLGISKSMVYANAKIIETFFEAPPDEAEKAESSLTGQRTLPEPELEKTYYLLALRSKDPAAALKQFKELSQQNPDFTTRDARKLLQTQAAPSLDSMVKRPLDNPQINEVWAAYQRASEALGRAVPRLSKTLTAFVKDVEEEIARPPISLRELILEKVELGSDGGVTIEDLAEMVGCHRDAALNYLEELLKEGALIKKRRLSNYCKEATERGVDLYVLAG